MKITLCLLTFNEIVGCENDIPQIKKISDQFDEIYAIDGGSKDGTLGYLKEQNIPVYIQPKRGLNAACHYAIEKCTTDAIIFFHPKGAIPVQDTLKFKNLFENGYDFVIGSRLIKGAKNEEDDNFLKPRKWFVEILAFVASVLYKKRGQKTLWDALHGFRGVTLSGYRRMDLRDEGMVTIDIEMVIRSYRGEIKSTEFPTTETARLAGTTHFKAIPTGLKILQYLKRELQRRS